jgi:hypothetical protein
MWIRDFLELANMLFLAISILKFKTHQTCYSFSSYLNHPWSRLKTTTTPPMYKIYGLQCILFVDGPGRLQLALYQDMNIWTMYTLASFYSLIAIS